MKMKNNLTNEQIARVFAMYHNYTDVVTVSPFFNEERKFNLKGKLLSVNTETGECLIRSNNNMTARFGAYEVKKFLTPLSAISDEDAIEVDKMCADNGIRKGNKALCIKNGKTIANHIGYGSSGFGIQYVFIYQYLIQQGYAVPLFIAPNHPDNGKDAIELGLAIDKTKTPQ